MLKRRAIIAVVGFVVITTVFYYRHLQFCGAYVMAQHHVPFISAEDRNFYGETSNYLGTPSVYERFEKFSHLQYHSVPLISAEEGNVYLEENKYFVTPSVRKQFETFSHLPQQVIDHVQKFVFFTGYTRSGHTIMSKVLDANPNVVIGREFKVFRMLLLHNQTELINDKSYLFNQLYWRSWNASHSDRKAPVGKQLNNNTWYGMYKHLKVIGYKSAASATGMYIANASQFKQVYKQLSHTLQIPIYAIHVVRNPYDIIASNFRHKARFKREGQTRPPTENKDSENGLMGLMSKIFWLADGVLQMITDPELDLKVLEVHNGDYVMKPVETVKRICAFLEVDCPEGYVQACKEMAHTSVSKTREKVPFSQEMITDIGRKLKKYPFFRRYAYTSID